jgi:hypothetical protein
MSIGKLMTILNMGSWYNGFWTRQLGWTIELKALDLDQVFSLQGLINETQLFQWKPNAKI